MSSTTRGGVFAELAERLGADAIKGTDVGGFAYGASEIALQESWQAKLADPVTYDDDGERINRITSAYGLDTPDMWVKNQAAEGKTLRVYDEKETDSFLNGGGYKARHKGNFRFGGIVTPILLVAIAKMKDVLSEPVPGHGDPSSRC
jgi:hypothetical protein